MARLTTFQVKNGPVKGLTFFVHTGKKLKLCLECFKEVLRFYLTLTKISSVSVCLNMDVTASSSTAVQRNIKLLYFSEACEGRDLFYISSIVRKKNLLWNLCKANYISI